MGATPLTPSSSWEVAQPTGDFRWTYPLRVPPAPGGLAPDLALTYSSASVDGKVEGTQPSWVGDGWELSTGYVERGYRSCAQDATGDANNRGHKTGDLCWAGDNATLVLAGRTRVLVKDKVSGAWRMRDDDGTTIRRLTGGASADDNGEYWVVTTTDGTRYVFGRERRSATDPLRLESAWTVPVYGNNPGEPCHRARFADSVCTQAWRWNLEQVVDTSGNTMTYVYAKETNRYGRNNGASVSRYVRGGYLVRIDYGQRATTQATSPASGRVSFTVTERCVPSGTVTCGASQLTASHAGLWPDVPFASICTSATRCPRVLAPAFFTRKRLVRVTTSVRTADAYRAVDRWSLDQTFPSPGDGTAAVLWLRSLVHSGLPGANLTLPRVEFSGAQMDNRVDRTGDAGSPMIRYRVGAIRTESGERISVHYSSKSCTPWKLPTSQWTNTRPCMPVWWTPEGRDAPILEYFHKYVVRSVLDDPQDNESSAVATTYDYVGGAAWHYVADPTLPGNRRTWHDFRGYAQVDVTTGRAGTTRSRTATSYFRGMHGDRLPDGGTRWSVTKEGVTDRNRLRGMVRKTVTYNGVGGPVVATVLNTPWVSSATATAASGTTATLVGVAATETTTTRSSAAGGPLVTRTARKFDPRTGVPTRVNDYGDLARPADDTCTTLEYARNLAANIVATPRRVETVSVRCERSPTRPAEVVSDVRTSYDGGRYGAAPTRGRPTATQRVATYVGGTPRYVTESITGYDALGRATRVTDALGRVTRTAYTPSTGGPLTSTTVSTPDPDGSGPLTAHATVTHVDPAWGSPVRLTDPNAKVTTITRDALGRATAVWLPGRAPLTASMTFAYGVASVGRSWLSTGTLAADGATYLRTVTLLDGLLRPRQTQRTPSSIGSSGRVVTDTVYDSRGLVEHTNGPWAASGDPSGVLVTSAWSLPQQTRYTHDGAGRVRQVAGDVNEEERERTTTTYDGDSVSIDPPSGGTPTTAVYDARGRIIELRRYLGAGPTGPYRATTYGYTPAGKVSRVTDAAGNTSTFAYDLRGRRTASSDPDAGQRSSTYDDAGRLATSTNGRDETIFYARDALGRVTALRDDGPDGTLRARWTWDTLAKGHVTSSSRFDGGAEYVTEVTGYDDGYRPLGRTVTIPEVEGLVAGTYQTGYDYTVDGQVATVTLPAGGGLTAEHVATYYDARSNPEWMAGGAGYGVYIGGSSQSSYGEPLTYNLGARTHYSLGFRYEEGSRQLVDLRMIREGINGYDVATSYGYDAAGNSTAIVDRPMGQPVDAQCFQHDALRRLTRAWTPQSGDCSAAPSETALGGPAPYWTDTTYDVAGNRATQVSRSADGTATTTYTYPAAGAARPHSPTEVTTVAGAVTTSSSYGYDAAGSMTYRTVAGGPEETLAWDAEGRLTAVTPTAGVGASFVYGADGQRLVRHQDGVTTVYLPGGMELHLDTATGVTTATRYYVFDGTAVAVRTSPLGNTLWTLVGDSRGTVQMAIENHTDVSTTRRFDTFGNPRGVAPAWPGDHDYLNRPTDSTGLTLDGDRYYDPVLGRYISAA